MWWFVVFQGWVSVASAHPEDTPAPSGPPPITFAVDGGLSTASDTATSALSLATSLSRKPKPSQYGEEPFEFAVSLGWRRATAKGEVTNDQWLGGLRVDFNDIAGPVTLFGFATAERNLPANRRVDLLVAPMGAKLDIVATDALSVDAGFAPVWNYRSIVAEGEDCTVDGPNCSFSKLRGSLRFRIAVNRGHWHFEDQLTLLPTLFPVRGGFFTALQGEAVVRNDAKWVFKLSDRVAFSETVAFVRDPLLAAQATCDGTVDTTLCSGWMLNTATTLGIHLVL